MRIFASLVFLCASFLAFAQQTINGTITHDGIQRTYILYVPASYTAGTDVPLIINLHGYTSNASEQMAYGDFRSISDTAGFIVVHPQGTLDNQSTTHWNVGWGGSTVDDVGFLSALIDDLASQYSIDTDRVYSTGMSNGGFMSYELACQLSNKIAAIASVTGSMSPVTYNNCNPQHPVPVMEVHGTADGVVDYNGSSFSKSIAEVLHYWVGFNNCNATPAFVAVPNTNLLDGSTVEHYVYGGGDDGVEVEHFKIIGGGHTWPGWIWGGAGTGHNQDINASAEIWRFFSKYDINGLVSGVPTTLDHVSIQENFPKVVRVVDILGRDVTTSKQGVLFYMYDDGSVQKKLNWNR